MCQFGQHLLVLHLRFLSFFFFFFFFSAAMVDRSSVNSAFVHCSRTSQTLLFINFFIKNGSHSTIYTFKNYFATVFSVFSFQFQQNKFYPNGPLIGFFWGRRRRSVENSFFFFNNQVIVLVFRRSIGWRYSEKQFLFFFFLFLFLFCVCFFFLKQF